MHTVFLAILPIFLLIVAGYALKRSLAREASFWIIAEKLTYYLFFPALLILKVSQANFNGTDAAFGLIATIGATFLIAGLVFLLRSLIKMPDDLFTSVFQGSVRYNSYVFLAMAGALYGDAGLTLSGVFIAYMIALTNALSVMIMNRYGQGNKKGLLSVVRALFQNPLILGTLIGLICNISGIRFSGALSVFMRYLGDASTPLSLLSVGAGLNLIMPKEKLNIIAYTLIMKLLIMPLCALLLLDWLGVTGSSAQIALLYATLPCAGNAYILARQMGGDAEAMASIITWTTLGSSVTIALFMGIFG